MENTLHFVFFFIEIWKETEEEIDIMIEEVTENVTGIRTSSVEYQLVMMLVLFLLRLQSKHYIPDSAISSMLKFLYTFFSVISRVSQIGKTIAEIIPQNV